MFARSSLPKNEALAIPLAVEARKRRRSSNPTPPRAMKRRCYRLRVSLTIEKHVRLSAVAGQHSARVNFARPRRSVSLTSSGGGPDRLVGLVDSWPQASEETQSDCCQAESLHRNSRFSARRYSPRVKRNSISHRFICTKMKVYRAVISAVAGFRRRYFAHMTRVSRTVSGTC